MSDSFVRCQCAKIGDMMKGDCSDTSVSRKPFAYLGCMRLAAHWTDSYPVVEFWFIWSDKLGLPEYPPVYITLGRMKSIATSSVEEGLDFGFNLLVGPAADGGRNDGVLAQRLLTLIEQFVHPRYAGEPDIALDALEGLADCVPMKYQRNRDLIESQIAWLREQLPRVCG